MDTLPVFIVLHTLGVSPTGEFTVGADVVINPSYISAMLPSEARGENDLVRQCTSLVIIGVSEPLHVVESSQDICDLILRANGMDSPSDPEEGKLFMPYEAAVRDENPWTT